MRVAYVNAFYYPKSTTGGNAHVGQFVNQAVTLGHEVWTNPENQHEAVKHLPSGRLARLKALRSMDLIYTRLEWSPPGPIRWSLSPYRELLGSPVIVWEFNTVPEFGLLLGKPQRAIEEAVTAFKRYGQGCDLAVCVSKALSEYVRDCFNLRRVITVPNGSDPDLFRPDLSSVKRIQLDSAAMRVVWIGSANVPWHNFDLLCETADYLWRFGPRDQVTFHIIGDGLTGMRDMPPNVNYYGAEHYDKLPYWLSAMDVGLVSYRDGPGYYSSPLKLFDYMASGLTVVGTPQPQVRAVLTELGQSDLLLEGEDPEELASLLLRLARDREQVKERGAAARELVVRKYNWKRLVARIFDEIKKLISE